MPTLYGDELARFNEIIAALKPLTDRLMAQNDAIGATLESLGGIAAELNAWVAAGHVEAGHLMRLSQLVNASVNPAKVSKMVAAVTALGGISPGLVLVTDDLGDGSAYTPVTPAP
jgi:phage-related minor tail protein